MVILAAGCFDIIRRDFQLGLGGRTSGAGKLLKLVLWVVRKLREISNSICFWVDCGNGVVSSMFSTCYTIKAQSTSQRLSLHLLEGKTREDVE